MLGQEPASPLPLQASLTRLDRPTARTAACRLAVGLLLGGCATGADVAGLATQDDVIGLRADVMALQRSVQQARIQSEALGGQASGRREQPVEGDQRAQAINQRLDGLAATLTVLTRRVDDLTTRVDTLGRLVRATPAPARPAASPAAGPPAPPPGPAPTFGAPSPSTASPVTAVPTTAGPAAAPPAVIAAPVPASARPATGALQPQDLYQVAYIDFSKGSYALAIDGFRELLRRYPDHQQANSAQYWIGEGYVALAQQYGNAGQVDRVTEALQRAVQEFKKVVANYPRGDRVPTALYKEALTLIELKQPAVAQARLQYLVENFPQAEETPLARERLSALRQR